MTQPSVKIVDFYDGPLSGFVDAGPRGSFEFRLLAASQNLYVRLFAVHPMTGGPILFAVKAEALKRPEAWIPAPSGVQASLESRGKDAPMDPLAKWTDVLREASGTLSCLYPHYLDIVWFAIDRAGHVAGFATAGEGPIPEPSLIVDPEGDCEHVVEKLPRSSDSRVLLRLPRDESYVALARRGIFAYDWQAVDRKPVTNAYDLVAAPTKPAHVNSLTGPIKQAGEAFEYPGLFGELRSVPALTGWVVPHS